LSEYQGLKITKEAYRLLISVAGKLQAEKKERVTISEAIIELTKTWTKVRLEEDRA